MSRLLAARVAKLEARHKAASDKPKGVIGGRFNGSYIEEIDGVLYLRREEPPGGFAEYARNQQNALQSELLRLFANTTDTEPQPKAPSNVGIVNNPAPLKPGEKQKNFIHLADGTEIALKRI